MFVKFMWYFLFVFGNLIFFLEVVFREKKSWIFLNEKKYWIRGRIYNINMRKNLGRLFMRIKVKFIKYYSLDKIYCNDVEMINFLLLKVR